MFVQNWSAWSGQQDFSKTGKWPTKSPLTAVLKQGEIQDPPKKIGVFPDMSPPKKAGSLKGEPDKMSGFQPLLRDFFACLARWNQVPEIDLKMVKRKKDRMV